MNIFKRIFGPRIKISAPAPTSETQAAAVPKDAGNYSPDQPIQSKSQDRFNRWPFSERIASTIAGRQDPSSIVIGIYGAWGDGKSSVLAMMEEALAEHDDIVRVRFNPWYFKSEEQVLRSFFSALAKAIDRSLPTKAEKIGEALEKYGSLLSLTALIPGGPDAGSAAQGVGRVFASASEIDGLRDRIEGFLKESKKRVVVLIDDIDRLDRREIQTIFKLVKLSANFQHTAYVLAFDDKMVAEALGEAYANGGAAAGRGFLEKIVQVPLHLPVADALELRRMTFEGVDACLVTSGIELSEEQVQHFSRYFVDGIEPRLVTPRQAKLYTNTLMFALPLMKGEVNPVDQMLIEGIRVFYPDLYAMIRDNPEVFASGGYAVDSREFQEQAAALVAGALTGVASATAKRVRERLVNKLFPRLDGSMYGGDWDKSWENEQRVCSNDYFDRYFRYGVNPADVSDVALSSFLEKIPTADSSEVDQLFAQFNRGDRLGRLVAKLRASDKPLDPAVAVRLANLFARHAANLPRERQMFFNDWSLAQAGILLSELLRQLPEGKEREDAARAVFGQVTSLPFAFECVRWFRTSKKKEEAEGRLLSEEVEAELEKELAERVRTEAAKEPLHKTFGTDSPRMYWVWKKHEKPGEVAAYLEDRFAKDPAEAEEFLAAFIGTAWGLESGIPQKADFHRSEYDACAGLIEPSVVLTHLRSRYGTAMDVGSEYPLKKKHDGERAALQFAFYYRITHQSADGKPSGEAANQG